MVPLSDYTIDSVMNPDGGQVVPRDSSPLSLPSADAFAEKKIIPLLCVDFHLTEDEYDDYIKYKHDLGYIKDVRTLEGKNRRRANDLSLHDCMTAFSSREQLGNDDAWYCPKCKKHVRAFKEMTLWRLPEVLIVHLKRFKVTTYNAHYSTVSKIDRGVNYPSELSVETYLAPGAPGASHNADGVRSPLFDLFAMSIHSGSPGGGHYWAHVFNFRTKQWAEMDDSRVMMLAVGAPPPMSREAYVLFYIRRMASFLSGAGVRVIVPSPERSLRLGNTSSSSSSSSSSSANQESGSLYLPLHAAAASVSLTESSQRTVQSSDFANDNDNNNDADGQSSDDEEENKLCE
jgi:ubiquitin carboxyl-terminal hydrolase 4/11/15